MASAAQVEEVRRWLAEKAKLERYCEQLLAGGFNSLAMCARISENDLDSLGIKLPGHRKRLLLCSRELSDNMDLQAEQASGSNGLGGTEQHSAVADHSQMAGPHGPSPRHAPTVRSAPPLPPEADDGGPPPLPPNHPHLLHEEQNQAQGQQLATHPVSERPQLDATVSPKKKALLPNLPPRGSSMKQRGSSVNSATTAAAATRLSAVSPPIPENEAVTKSTPPPLPPDENDDDHCSSTSSAATPITSPARSPETAPDVPSRKGDVRRAVSMRTPSPDKQQVAGPNVPSRSSSVRRKPRQSPVSSPEATEQSASGRAVSPLPSNPDTLERRPPMDLPSTPAQQAVAPTESRSAGSTSLSRSKSAREIGKAISSRLPASRSGSSALLGVSVFPVAPMKSSDTDGDISGQKAHQPLAASKSASSLGLAKNGPPSLPARTELVERPSQSLSPPTAPARAPRSEQRADGQQSPQHSASDEIARSADGRMTERSATVVAPSGAPAPAPRSQSRGQSIRSTARGPAHQVLGNERHDSTISQRSRKASTLSTLAKGSSSSPMGSMNRQGYLYKTGNKQETGAARSGWRHRWCTFNGYNLKYYANKERIKEEDAKGKVVVQNMRSVELEYVPSDTKHQYHILLETPDRTFVFATDDEKDAGEWMQCFKTAIDSFKPGMDTALKEGGHMAEPDKQGHLLKQGHGIRADWKRRYVALKGGSFCYYNTMLDFRDDNPIHEIKLKTTAIKPSVRNRFQLVTPTKSYEFQCDDAEELQSWITAVQEGILSGLSDMAAAGSADSGVSSNARSKDIIRALYEQPANMKCADCGAPDPTWASCNLLVTVCIDCSGIHRSLGVTVSKVRSLELDVNMWQDDLVELFNLIGNEVANEYWMKNCRSSPIDSTSEMIIRDSFIRTKYAGAWCDRNPDWEDPGALSKQLIVAVQRQDLVSCYRLLVAGASPTYECPDLPEECNTAVGLASEYNFPALSELISQFHTATRTSSSTSPDSGADGTGGRCSLDDDETVLCAGCLRTSGVSDKTPQLRHFELTGMTLRFFKSEADKQPIGCITCQDISSITSGDDMAASRDHPFSLQLSTTYGRQYTLSADTQAEISRWDTALSEVVDTLQESGQIRKFRKTGFLSKRGEHGSGFRRRWFTLDDDCTELAYHRDGEEAGIIDLRKMTELQREDNKEGFCFNIVTSERTYFLQAETAEDMEAWCYALNSAFVFGVDISIQKRTNTGIPWLVEKCLLFIQANGMECEGLYRISGRKASMEKLKASFQADAQSVILDTSMYSVHDVTGLLKDYFRNLPSPLLTADLYPNFIAAAEVADHDAKLLAIRDCICALPPVNYYSLKRMLGHLVCVTNNEETTKMPVTNLSMIFGPTLMTTEQFRGRGLQGANLEFQVISMCMTYYNWMFQISDEEIKEAERVKDAIEKMKQLSERPPATNVSQNFIVGIYIGPVSYGRTVSATISSTMTGKSLLQNLLERNQLPVDDDEVYWPYLCLHGDDLRRPLSRVEMVLSSCMGWSADIDAKLAMFSDAIIGQIQAKTLSLHGQCSAQVQLKEKKGNKWAKWQKRFASLTGTRLSISKDASSSSTLVSVDLSTCSIYIGIENPKVTKPPSSFCISIIPRSDQKLDECRCLCFDDPDIRLSMLAAIYDATDTKFC